MSIVFFADNVSRHLTFVNSVCIVKLIRSWEDDEMAEKTPVSILQELCVQECTVPMYESVPHETDSKMFAFVVAAFGVLAQGSGRSKREAKHNASANIISILSQMDKFRDRLSNISLQAPRASSEVDAIGALLDICVQRAWPIAQFEVMQASGEPHRPEFTYVCQLAHIKRTGTSSTKKGAKQIAAQEMLAFVQNISQNEEQQQIATITAEPTEKTFRTYRELKKSDVKPLSIRIRDRHNYFLRLPSESIKAAYDILTCNDSIIGTSKDKVDLVCKALNIRYEIKDIPSHPKNHKVFLLQDDYDCVIIDGEPELYDRTIQYFKIMMNVTSVV